MKKKRNDIIPYRKDLKLLARKLRKNSTLSEILLWQQIKNRQVLGHEFHRQVPMLDYIVDFYCHALHLIIEIDGDSHSLPEVAANDIIRQQRLEEYGLHFLRFADIDVKRNIDAVVGKIEEWIMENGL
ncbi:MAG: endonuclease domain-containing protein [Cyclobacteriaceae bacterium]